MCVYVCIHIHMCMYICMCVCVCVCVYIYIYKSPTYIYVGDLVTESCLTLAAPWTVAHQAPLSKGSSRQEYWSGLSFPTPGYLPDQGLDLGFPHCRQIPTDLRHQRSLYIYIGDLVTESCPTLCDPMDCSLPGSSLYGILQARVQEWVAIAFSRGSSWPRDRTWVSCIPGRRFKPLSYQVCFY